MVVVVAGADDLAVADAEHEDSGQHSRLPGAVGDLLVLELGDDDLGVGCLVDGDVSDPAVWPGRPGRPGRGVGWRGLPTVAEVRADFVAAAQRGGAQRVERMHDVGLFRVEVGQLVQAAVGHAVHECEEDLLRAAGLGHGGLLSSPGHAAGSGTFGVSTPDNG
jgi:hypothetical protein